MLYCELVDHYTVMHSLSGGTFEQSLTGTTHACYLLGKVHVGNSNMM